MPEQATTAPSGNPRPGRTGSRSRAAVLVIALTVVLTGCAAGGHEAGPSKGASSPPAVVTSTDAHMTELVLFNGTAGAAVTGPQDASKLAGAPADLQEFLGHLASTYATTCKHREPIYVRGYDKAGFADATGTDRCGLGAEFIFASSGGTWHQIWAGQDMAECSQWQKLKIPTEFIRRVVEPGPGPDCYESGAPAHYASP